MGKINKIELLNKQQDLLSNLLNNTNSHNCWQAIYNYLLEVAPEASQAMLHQAIVKLDRLLAESAWNLWYDFKDCVTSTAEALKDWWEDNSVGGRAILILDALSLRELKPLIENARANGLEPISVKITGAELPTETEQFAKALSASSRASLYNNGATDSFLLGGKATRTDVLTSPFQDCLGDVPPTPDIFLWHCWLDDLIHLYKRDPEEVENAVQQEFTGPGFWQLINKMRKGRKLVVTSDHGYANCKLFSNEETEQQAKDVLIKYFGAGRSCMAETPFPVGFMPPLAATIDNHHMVLGQRRWKVQGGYPHLTHGGLSVFEALVPFIEFSEET
ncbi:MAG: hypothetical protein ACYCX4_17130 [Bacillota bacterium]